MNCNPPREVRGSCLSKRGGVDALKSNSAVFLTATFGSSGSSILTEKARNLPSGERSNAVPDKKLLGTVLPGTSSAFPAPLSGTRQIWFVEEFSKYAHFPSREQTGKRTACPSVNFIAPAPSLLARHRLV